MTDNEIIKALECCANWESDKSCEECPANIYGFSCANKMAKHYLDLINRQKAEIEKLKQENEFFRKTITENAQRALEVTVEEIETAKSETIKKFSERLKEKLNNLEYHENSYRKTVTKAKLYHVVNWIMHEVVPDEIDNLVTEMTEVEE